MNKEPSGRQTASNAQHPPSEESQLSFPSFHDINAHLSFPSRNNIYETWRHASFVASSLACLWLARRGRHHRLIDVSLSGSIRIGNAPNVSRILVMTWITPWFTAAWPAAWTRLKIHKLIFGKVIQSLWSRYSFIRRLLKGLYVYELVDCTDDNFLTSWVIQCPPARCFGFGLLPSAADRQTEATCSLPNKKQ